MGQGNKFYKAQNYEAAIEQYNKILAIDTNNYTANYLVAMSYLAMYHPGSTHPKDIEYCDKSSAQFEKLMTLKAPDPETDERVRNYYVALLRSADRTEKVVAYYEAQLKANPQNATLVSQLAEIYAKKGDFDNALKYYQQRTQIEPQNKEAWYTIGVVCWERGKNAGPTLPPEDQEKLIQTGLDAMDKALAIDANYFEALVYTGLLWRQRSSLLASEMKNEEAGAAFTKAEEFRGRAQEIGKKRMADAAAKKK
jgi:tetratricopeptide (TPR) repeat protein